MPQEIRNFEKPEKKGRPSKYPFDQWVERLKKLGRNGALRIRKGSDFHCQIKSMTEYCHRTKKFHVYAGEREVIIQLREKPRK